MDNQTKEPRQCYYIIEGQDTEKTGGYVPSLVTEGISGHQPLMGRGECSAPWVWGKTYEKAMAICNKKNANNGLTEKDVWKIVASSMFASA